MALKPIEPRDGSAAEKERHNRDLAHAQAQPHAWADGPEHAPKIPPEDIAAFLAERAGYPDLDRASERPVAPGTAPGALPPGDPDAGKSTKARK